MEKMKRKRLFFLALLMGIQVLVFAPHVGKGFITDDFHWLENVVPNGEIDYLKPFSITTGFLRPLVGISFGIQYTLHGMNPLPYGLFNLLLHMLNIILVYLVLSQWEKTKPTALAAAALFALNAKAANMAVCWISGRTTLMFTFFMLLSLYLFLKNRRNRDEISPTAQILRSIPVSLAFLAALLSKETAVAAPLFIFFFAVFNHTGQRGKIKKAMWAVLPFTWPAAAYFVLRFSSNAYTPYNGPDYYRYTFDPGLLLQNIFEYIIRAGILDIYLLAILVLLAVVSRAKKQTPYNRIDRGASVFGVLWFLCFLLPMLPLAARSDIYAYFPQIGLHVAFLVFISNSHYFSRFLRHNTHDIKRKSITAAAMLLFLTAWTGLLWMKADSSCRKAEAAALFTGQVVRAVSQIEAGSRIRVIDTQAGEENSPSKTISYGFNSMLHLYYPHKDLTGEIVPVSGIRGLNRKTVLSGINFTWKNNRLIRIAGRHPYKKIRKAIDL